MSGKKSSRFFALLKLRESGLKSSFLLRFVLFIQVSWRLGWRLWLRWIQVWESKIFCINLNPGSSHYDFFWIRSFSFVPNRIFSPPQFSFEPLQKNLSRYDSLHVVCEKFAFHSGNIWDLFQEVIANSDSEPEDLFLMRVFDWLSFLKVGREESPEVSCDTG